MENTERPIECRDGEILAFFNPFSVGKPAHEIQGKRRHPLRKNKNLSGNTGFFNPRASGTW